jgi:hypothetical protein
MAAHPRPLETKPGPAGNRAPAGDLALADFGRRAQRIADDLMVLAALPEASRMQPDAYNWEEIRHVADTLRGMTLRCARETDDRELLTEVTRGALRRPRPRARPAAGGRIPSPE